MDSWSDLPYDLLDEIAKKLRHKELLYFGFVCKPWRFFYLENRCRLPADLPILLLTQSQPHRAPFLLQSCKPDSDSRKYVSVLSEKVESEIFLPEAANKWICGSSRGWLVTRDIKGQEISLLNPFTRCQIKLPSLTTLSACYDHARRHYIDLIYKAIISTDPISNPQDCDVMAVAGYSLYDPARYLCFCKLGDTEWSYVQRSLQQVDDVIHYQDRFYVSSQSGLVLSYDAKNPNAHEIEHLTRAPLGYYRERHTYLVLSGGDLLQIQRIRGFPSDPLNPKKKQTVKFKVFKLVKTEPCIKNKSIEMGVLSSLYFFRKKLFKRASYEENKYHWSRVENMDDHLLFIGINDSFSVPSSVHPNCKGNTIYFSDDYRLTHYSNLLLYEHLLDLDQYPFGYYHHDIGVYDMEDKSCRSYHPSEQFDILPAIWIIPHPW